MRLHRRNCYRSEFIADAPGIGALVATGDVVPAESPEDGALMLEFSDVEFIGFGDERVVGAPDAVELAGLPTVEGAVAAVVGDKAPEPLVPVVPAAPEVPTPVDGTLLPEPLPEVPPAFVDVILLPPAPLVLVEVVGPAALPPALVPVELPAPTDVVAATITGVVSEPACDCAANALKPTSATTPNVVFMRFDMLF